MKPITGPGEPDDGGSAGGDADGGLFTGRRRAKKRPGGTRARAGGGNLLSSSPARGFLALLGGLAIGYLVATLVLFPAAKGPVDLEEVPDLRGMQDVDAILALEDAGLVLGAVDSLLLPSEAAGTVIGQSPLPGQLGTDTTRVRMTVSAGALRLPIPDVVGLPLDRALDLLDAAGFDHQVDTVESDQGGGVVVAVSPSVGERATVPSTVALEVSLGPPEVLVPDLVGMEEDRARATIDSLGLTVGDIEVQFRFGLDQGKVVRQEPAPGVTVEHGAAVRIVVGRRGGGAS